MEWLYSTVNIPVQYSTQDGLAACIQGFRVPAFTIKLSASRQELYES